MSWISYDDQETLSEQQRRLFLHNIAACQAFKAGLVKLPPLSYQPIVRDYKSKPLKTSLQLAAPRERKQAKNRARIEAKYNRPWEPVPPVVQVTAVAPFPPPNSAPCTA